MAKIQSISEEKLLAWKAKQDKEAEKSYGNPEFISTTITDENGEVIRESTRRFVKQNRGGFVLSYTAKMQEFLLKNTNPTVIRVFLYIAHRQGFGDNDGIFGYRCTRQHLADILRVNRKTIFDALKYLEDNFLVVENRFEGQLEFMVNPDYITIGSNRKKRDQVWSERWVMFFKYKEMKKH